MLHIQKPDNNLGISVPTAAETFHSLTAFARRQWTVVLAATLVCLLLGSAYLVTARPVFTAQALLIMDARKNQVFQQQSILGDNPMDTAAVESQVEVLKSENVALSVIKSLRLQNNPEFMASGSGLFGALVKIASSLFERGEEVSDFEAERRAIKIFKSNLTAKRVGLSYVIEISYRSYDGEISAKILNALADAYVVDQLEAKYQSTKRAGVWLQERIAELGEQSSKAERAVVEFKTKNNIVNTGGAGDRLVSDQQVSELNSQWVIARAQKSEARARLDRIEAVLRIDNPDATVNSTVTDSIKSDVVSKLRTQYLELANREADWSARYGSSHLAALNLRNQMREIRKSILEELRRLAESYKSDFEIAKQREEGLQNELNEAVVQSQSTNQAKVALRGLESNAHTYRTLYDNFLQRYMESVQQQSFPISEARLISPAAKPLGKSSPQLMIVLAMCGLAGVALGIAIGMLREWSDQVIRTGEQVEAILQTDCISLVPIVKSAGSGLLARSLSGLKPGVRSGSAKAALPASQRSLSAETASLRRITNNGNVMWSAVDEPLSRFAEAIRSIKLAVDIQGGIKSGKSIAFTSTLPDEGKTTTAGAFALLVARTGARTLLIDADLRNPSLSRALAPEAKGGILEVINNEMHFDQVVWKHPETNLYFLPAVTIDRMSQSSEILSSDATKQLFDRLRQHFDYIIVDLSPLAPIVDVRATTNLVDSYVLVVEWARTRADVVMRVLGGAKNVRANLLGAVLTKVDIGLLSRYDGNRAGYYYNRHYSRYGYID